MSINLYTSLQTYTIYGLYSLNGSLLSTVRMRNVAKHLGPIVVVNIVVITDASQYDYLHCDTDTVQPR